jgi:hypothetical protein
MPKGARVVSVEPGSKGWNVYASHITPPADKPLEMAQRGFVSLKTGTEFPVGANYLTTIRGGLHVLELPTAGHVQDWHDLYPQIDESAAEATIQPHNPKA